MKRRNVLKGILGACLIALLSTQVGSDEPESVEGYQIVPETIGIFDKEHHPFVGEFYDSVEAAKEEINEYVEAGEDYWEDNWTALVPTGRVFVTTARRDSRDLVTIAIILFDMSCGASVKNKTKETFRIRYVEDIRFP